MRKLYQYIVNIFGIVPIAIAIIIWMAIYFDLRSRVDDITSRISFFGAIIALITYIYTSSYNIKRDKNNNAPALRLYDFNWKPIPINHSEKEWWSICYCPNEDCHDVHLLNIRLDQGSEITILEAKYKETKNWTNHKKQISNVVWSVLSKGMEIQIREWLKDFEFIVNNKWDKTNINVYLAYKTSDWGYYKTLFKVQISNIQKELSPCASWAQTISVCKEIAKVPAFEFYSRSLLNLSSLETLWSVRNKTLKNIFKRDLEDWERLTDF